SMARKEPCIPWRARNRRARAIRRAMIHNDGFNVVARVSLGTKAFNASTIRSPPSGSGTTTLIFVIWSSSSSILVSSHHHFSAHKADLRPAWRLTNTLVCTEAEPIGARKLLAPSAKAQVRVVGCGSSTGLLLSPHDQRTIAPTIGASLPLPAGSLDR